MALLCPAGLPAAPRGASSTAASAPGALLHRKLSHKIRSPSHADKGCGAPQGFPLPSAAQVAARLRRFAARLSAEDVLPNSKAYVVAALFPDEASAAAAAAHLKGAADAMFSAAKVPCALACVCRSSAYLALFAPARAVRKTFCQDGGSR